MVLWIIFGVLLLGVLLSLFVSVMQAHGPEPSGHNANIYYDQLVEIDKDLVKGLLSHVEANTLKAEIKQRIKKINEDTVTNTTDKKYNLEKSFILMLILILVIPIVSLGLYSYLGSPGTSDQPFAERNFSNPGETANATMNQLISALQQRLKQKPDQLDGWILLGRSLASSNRYVEASYAFERALKLNPERSDIAASLAEINFLAMDGRFTEDIRVYIKMALTENPKEHKALYYNGLDLFTQKKYKEAIQVWVDLITISPAGSPWLDTVRDRLIEASSVSNLKISEFRSRFTESRKPLKEIPAGPTKDDIDAAKDMSEQERDDFIRQMVRRLAERLQREPTNIAGWRQLARSYKVLGEMQKAMEVEAKIKLLEK